MKRCGLGTTGGRVGGGAIWHWLVFSPNPIPSKALAPVDPGKKPAKSRERPSKNLEKSLQNKIGPLAICQGANVMMVRL